MFKNFEDYKNQREALINAAQTALENGDNEAYTAKFKAVEDLDAAFENFRQAQANLKALNDKAPKMPENLFGNIETEKVAMQNVRISDDYYNAFYNYLRGEDMTPGQLSAFEETNGFSAAIKTTSTESAAVPVQTLDKIWDLCAEQHSILGDIDIRRTGVVIRIVKRKAITSGKAKKVAEGTANTNLADTKVTVDLTGNDFSATVELSYAAAKMSIPALEDFLVKDLADQLSEAMSEDVISSIETDLPESNKMTSASTSTYTYGELCTLFSKLKRCNGFVAYVNNEVLYTQLVSMTDTTGRPLFQPNMQADAQGSLLGAKIKIESSVKGNKILVGDPKRVIANVIQDVMIETDRDIKTHTVIHSGYARMEAALIDDCSFAEIDLATATADTPSGNN